MIKSLTPDLVSLTYRLSLKCPEIKANQCREFIEILRGGHRGLGSPSRDGDGDWKFKNLGTGTGMGQSLGDGDRVGDTKFKSGDWGQGRGLKIEKWGPGL